MIRYHHRKKGTPSWKIILACGGGLLVVCLIISWIIIGINLSETRRLLLNVIDDNNEQKAFYDAISQSFLLLARDSNEMRSHLGYSEKVYPVLSREQSAEESQEDSAVFFDALNKIFQTNNREKNLIIFDSFIQNSQFLELLKQNVLESRLESDFTLHVFQAHNLYFSLQLSETDSRIQLNPYTDKSSAFGAADKDFLQAVQTAITRAGIYYTRIEEMVKGVDKQIHSNDFIKYLQGHTLTLSPPLEDFFSLSYKINFEEQLLLTFGINKQKEVLFVNNQQFNKPSEISERIIDTVNNLTLISAREKTVTEARQSLLDIFNDTAFIALLESYSLQVNPQPHEDTYFQYYDILNLNEERIGTFAIDKFSGEIYITDKDEIQICALKSLLVSKSDPVKKKIEIPDFLPVIDDIYTNKEGLTFLICGSNEKNTDTMIVVNVDARQKSITMFGLPRDLYYRGHRINTVYHKHNATQFLEELSEITGLNIEKYIHIDMFAFIEVINILGGIDVTLQYELIDPSYKVKENGKWGTLHYTRGRHHLNGVQALRIARSRHYTSDFDRSRRQQQILISVSNKLKELGISNLDKVSNLVQVLLKYVRTDFSVFELVQYFNKYKDFTINAQHTLDTNNVLDATYTNIYYLTQHDQEYVIDENFEKGGWILVPRDNDWNLIKWYIRELLDSPQGS